MNRAPRRRTRTEMPNGGPQRVTRTDNLLQFRKNPVGTHDVAQLFQRSTENFGAYAGRRTLNHDFSLGIALFSHAPTLFECDDAVR